MSEEEKKVRELKAREFVKEIVDAELETRKKAEEEAAKKREAEKSKEEEDEFSILGI